MLMGVWDKAVNVYEKAAEIFDENQLLVTLSGMALTAGVTYLGTKWSEAKKLEKSETHLEELRHSLNDFKITETLYYPSGILDEQDREYIYQEVRTRALFEPITDLMPNTMHPSILQALKDACDWCERNNDLDIIKGLHEIAKQQNWRDGKLKNIKNILFRGVVGDTGVRMSRPGFASSDMTIENRLKPDEKNVYLSLNYEQSTTKEIRIFGVPEHWVDVENNEEFLPPKELVIVKVGKRETYPWDNESLDYHQYDRLEANRKTVKRLQRDPDLASNYKVGIWTGAYEKVPEPGENPQVVPHPS